MRTTARIDMKRTAALVLFVWGALTSSAQELTLMGMSHVHQRAKANPALFPEYPVNIGLPGLSSYQLNYYNTLFTPKMLFENNADGSVTLDPEKYLEQLKDLNYLGFGMSVDLLSVGIAKGENFFSFSASENISARLSVPADLLRYPVYGNADFQQYPDGVVSFEGFGLDFMHYREYALGFARQINTQLNVGGKLKYLYGMENMRTSESSFTWKTDPTTYDWTMTGKMEINTSGILKEEGDSTVFAGGPDEDAGETVGNYLFGRKNTGIGVDLGASYQVTNELLVYGSVVDLGTITWKDNVYSASSSGGSFVFQGMDFSELLLLDSADREQEQERIIEEMQDSLQGLFDLTSNSESYRTALTTKLFVGGQYDVLNTESLKGTAGVLLGGYLYKGDFAPSVTLSYTQSIGKWLQASAAYTMIDGDFTNLGVGLAISGSPAQFYVATDNILAMRFAKLNNEDGSGAVVPYGAKNMNVRFGINLVIGKRKKDTDKDKVPDEDDECPETFGSVEMNGCPDTDGDGVMDKLDECPQVKGGKMVAGCPDKDNDGVPDKTDECPDEKGSIELNGCPDKDKDGVRDSEDACPDVKGDASALGCPDQDGDTVRDELDKCPDAPGPLESGGCPDSDMDGILDKDDACPNAKGSAATGGCPDTDGDGVLDKDDRCPEVAGDKESKGCPKMDVPEDGDGN